RKHKIIDKDICRDSVGAFTDNINFAALEKVGDIALSIRSASDRSIEGAAIVSLGPDYIGDRAIRAGAHDQENCRRVIDGVPIHYVLPEAFYNRLAAIRCEAHPQGIPCGVVLYTLWIGIDIWQRKCRNRSARGHVYLSDLLVICVVDYIET